MKLTFVELEVLSGAANGESVAATALRLNRGRGTVKTHRAAVMHKLGAPNMTAAVRVAYESGLLGAKRTPRERVSSGQLAALNKKASVVDKMRDLDDRATKKAMFLQASLEFGRPIESFNDLDRAEASLVLDLLERMLDGAEARPGVGERDLISAGASA